MLIPFKYIPKSLKKELQEAVKYVESTFGGCNKLILDQNFCYDPQDFVKEVDFPDDGCDKNMENKLSKKVHEVNYDSKVTLELDVGNYNTYVITIKEFLTLIRQDQTVKHCDLSKCMTKEMALYRIDPNTNKDRTFLYRSFKENTSFRENILNQSVTYNDLQVNCSIVHGLSVYGLQMLESEKYSDFATPIQDEDYFVKIEGKGLIASDYETIINAYIYELSASNILHIHLSPKEVITDFLLGSDPTVNPAQLLTRTRPLKLGKGLNDLYCLYNIATATTDIDTRILRFTKILEYISQTVTKIDKISTIKQKLLSNRVLEPNADYILELESTCINLLGKYKTDKAALLQTILDCCDLDDFTGQFPSFLKNCCKLKSNPKKGKKKDKTDLLSETINEVARAISDTRNEIAHSKAGYNKTGCECPEDQKSDFVNIIQFLSIQAIRWYSSLDENQRIASNENN